MASTGDKDLDIALAGTDKEVFDNAFGKEGTVDHEDSADTSLEEAEDEATSDVAAGDAEGDASDDADTDADEAEDADDADKKAAGDEKPDADQPRDDKGKFADKDDKSKPGEQREERPRRGDPAIALRDERRAKDALKAELDKERSERATERERLARVEGQLDLVLKGQQAQPAKTDSRPEDAEPDMFVDPDGWKAWNRRQVESRIVSVEQKGEERFLRSSLADAADKHGDTFAAAYDAVNKLDKRNPEHLATINRIRNAANPGAELVKWHKKQVALSKVGDDPDAFINGEVERVLAAKMKDPEFRKQVIAQMRGEAGGDGDGNGSPQRPIRNIIRNPRSLNSEGGRAERANDSVDNDASDEAIFRAAFA